MERIVRGRSATLSHTFYSDATPTNPTPDTATVAITRADGTALVPAGSVDNSGAGVATLTLTPAETAQLDTLTLTWTATFGGQSQSFVDIVEVAGGTLFTIADARALQPLNDATKYPTTGLVAMRTTVEQALEDACGVAFVPRYEREILSTGCSSVLVARWPRITTIRSATIDGTAVTPNSDVIGVREGILYLTRAYRHDWGHSWGSPYGHGNVVIGYEHGYDSPPARVKRAALLLARAWLVSGPVDDRTTVMSSPESGITATLAVPGRGGSIFGLPEVDATVQQYNLRVGVA